MEYCFFNGVRLNYAYGLDHHRSPTAAEIWNESELRTGNNALRLNILVKVGLDKGEPLLDAAFNISSTITNVSNHFERELSAK